MSRNVPQNKREELCSRQPPALSWGTRGSQRGCLALPGLPAQGQTRSCPQAFSAAWVWMDSILTALSMEPSRRRTFCS